MPRRMVFLSKKKNIKRLAIPKKTRLMELWEMMRNAVATAVSMVYGNVGFFDIFISPKRTSGRNA